MGASDRSAAADLPAPPGAKFIGTVHLTVASRQKRSHHGSPSGSTCVAVAARWAEPSRSRFRSPTVAVEAARFFEGLRRFRRGCRLSLLLTHKKIKDITVCGSATRRAVSGRDRNEQQRGGGADDSPWPRAV
jgi:hypothetical protein